VKAKKENNGDWRYAKSANFSLIIKTVKHLEK
jgi:hypothetical protein